MIICTGSLILVFRPVSENLLFWFFLVSIIRRLSITMSNFV